MQNYLDSGLAFRTPPVDPDIFYEMECRVIFRNIDYRPVEKFIRDALKLEVPRAIPVQKFGKSDVYNSQTFRVKRLIEKQTCFVPPDAVIPFYLSKETRLKPLDAVHIELVEANKREANLAFYIKHPPKRQCVTLHAPEWGGGCIDMKLWESFDGIFDLVLELEFDPTRDCHDVPQKCRVFLDLCGFVAREVLRTDFFINFSTKMLPEPTRVLTDPSRELDGDGVRYVASLKWNGTQRKVMARTDELVFEGRGLEPSVLMPMPSLLRLKRERPFIAHFLKAVGLVVEYLSEYDAVVIDLPLRDPIMHRVRLIQKLEANVRDLRDVYEMPLRVQEFLTINFGRILRDMPIPTAADAVAVVGDGSAAAQLAAEPVDGYVLTTPRRIYKIKPRCFQTIDLLYNSEKIFVTCEGIQLFENDRCDLAGVEPVVNQVYEFRIASWKDLDFECFHKVDKLFKLRFLRRCSYVCTRCRLDRGTSSNSFQNICDYLESDLFDVVCNYKRKNMYLFARKRQ